MPTLLELIEQIDQVDLEIAIGAKQPWRPTSEAQFYKLTDEPGFPIELKHIGYEYFLEVDLVRQILREFDSELQASLLKKCERVVHYATYDA